MKNLILSSLLVLSTMNAFATECTKVYKTCVTEVNVAKDLKEFLNLEEEIGQDTYDLHHVNQFKVYRAENAYAFTHYGSSMASLNALGKWATKELGVYESPEYDGFEMLKSAEKMDITKFEKFITDSLIDMETKLAEIASGEDDDFTPEMKAKVARYMAIKGKAVKMLLNLVKSEREIVVYDLLDNNNENVQDAEFVIVSDDTIILMNRFWWL